MFIVSTISYKVLISYKGKACEDQKRMSLPPVSYYLLPYPLETGAVTEPGPLPACTELELQNGREVYEASLGTILRLHFK